MNKEFITWNLYDHKVGILAKQIDNSGFIPDIIIGVMRGGVIPAIMLSHHFDCICEALIWSYRDSMITDHGKLSDIFSKYKTKKILFVEDIVDSGKTMHSLQNHISQWYPQSSGWVNEIKYASVWYNTAQATTVDYCSVEFDRNENKDWFVFPWESR